jgi:hypothetical protein
MMPETFPVGAIVETTWRAQPEQYRVMAIIDPRAGAFADLPVVNMLSDPFYVLQSLTPRATRFGAGTLLGVLMTRLGVPLHEAFYIDMHSLRLVAVADDDDNTPL